MNKMLTYSWIFVIMVLQCMGISYQRENQDNIQKIEEAVEKLSDRIDNRTKEFLLLKPKLDADLEALNDLNRITDNSLNNFKNRLRSLDELIQDIKNSSDLEKIVEKQGNDLKIMEANLSKIIEGIMRIDRKLDTWDGNPNPIFNEFEKISDFIPIGLLSIFIIFITLKICVAGKMNRSDDPQETVNLVEAELEQAQENAPAVILDYERPLQFMEPKYLDLSIDRRQESKGKLNNSKDQKGSSTKVLKENQKEMDAEKPIVLGISNKHYDKYF